MHGYPFKINFWPNLKRKEYGEFNSGSAAMTVRGNAQPVFADGDPASARSSKLPEAGIGVDHVKREGRSRIFFRSLALLSAVSLICLSPSLINLWTLWTNDPLRSIGMLIVPASLVLTLRVWRQTGWESIGTWWGLLPISLAYLLNLFGQTLAWYWVAGRVGVNFLPASLSLYLYCSGIILLFAGVRVWWKAGFPLALLLFAQPLPNLASRLVDLPLQTLSAHIARSFATLIGFPPTSPQLLRLMFTPDFGMFIAPGCDGMRGAVTLGYVALVTGYLKRAPIRKCFLYVAGAVFLGYLCNLIRLCALVLYYRIAVGHPALEQVAKQADYVIGGCLILAITILSLWVVSRKEESQIPPAQGSVPLDAVRKQKQGPVSLKFAAFASLTMLFMVPAASALRDYRDDRGSSSILSQLKPEQLDELMPKQLGDYRLNRAWQQRVGSAYAVESADYAAPGSNDIILGVWLLPIQHSVHDSRSIQGEDPEMRSSKSFVTAGEQIVSFDTAYYSDGITDTLAGNVVCTPSSCSVSHNENGMHLAFLDSMNFKVHGTRAVPIYFRIEAPHADRSKDDIYAALSTDAQRFLRGVNLGNLSRAFQ
jgi:exosortase J